MADFTRHPGQLYDDTPDTHTHLARLLRHTITQFDVKAV